MRRFRETLASKGCALSLSQSLWFHLLQKQIPSALFSFFLSFLFFSQLLLLLLLLLAPSSICQSIYLSIRGSDDVTMVFLLLLIPNRCGAANVLSLAYLGLANIGGSVYSGNQLLQPWQSRTPTSHVWERRWIWASFLVFLIFQLLWKKPHRKSRTGGVFFFFFIETMSRRQYPSINTWFLYAVWYWVSENWRNGVFNLGVSFRSTF